MTALGPVEDMTEITSIEAIPVSHSLDPGRGVGSARGIHRDRQTTLVRLETTEGTVGWGEAFAPARAVATLIEDVLADRVIGMDPADTERFVEESYTRTYHFGRSAMMRCAVSGIDVACWDVRGKRTGTPINELLGGGAVDSLTPYASTGYVTEWGQDVAEPIERAVEEGFTAAKIKIGRGIDDDVERVRTAREILGPDGTLMVDYNGNYRPKQAIRSAEAIAEYDVAWIEEPVPAEHYEGLASVSDAVAVPVAAGEAHFSRFQFDRLIEDRTVDVVQPNLGRCGGFTDAQFVTRRATTENVAVRPHVWNSGIGVAAAIHFAASVPDYPHAENVPEPLLFEFDRSENPLRSDLLETSLDPIGGELAVPDDPGLGVTPDPDWIEAHRIDGA
jgi:D-galactarolactone cycloisomerase